MARKKIISDPRPVKKVTPKVIFPDVDIFSIEIPKISDFLLGRMRAAGYTEDVIKSARLDLNCHGYAVNTIAQQDRWNDIVDETMSNIPDDTVMDEGGAAADLRKLMKESFWNG